MSGEELRAALRRLAEASRNFTVVSGRYVNQTGGFPTTDEDMDAATRALLAETNAAFAALAAPSTPEPSGHYRCRNCGRNEHGCECGGATLEAAPSTEPALDVDRLREAARRARLPREVTVADIENLAAEYAAPPEVVGHCTSCGGSDGWPHHPGCARLAESR